MVLVDVTGTVVVDEVEAEICQHKHIVGMIQDCRTRQVIKSLQIM